VTPPDTASASLVVVSKSPLPSFVDWSSFPFDGKLTIKKLDDPVAIEPPRTGEDPADCAKCHAPDDAYIWVNENWRVRSMDRPSGLPMVLILESRSHLDLGDLPNMLAAELGVMTVRLERAIRSLDGVARVHVNRWGDAAAHLHVWFMARPYGRLQLRGTFLTLWDEILPPIPETQWQENLALIAAWLAEFGGEPLAKPPRIDWKAPSSLPAETGRPAPSAAGVAEADARQDHKETAGGQGHDRAADRPAPVEEQAGPASADKLEPEAAAKPAARPRRVPGAEPRAHGIKKRAAGAAAAAPGRMPPAAPGSGPASAVTT
jgi:hypothetical protein